jgi:hypothetical protein
MVSLERCMLVPFWTTHPTHTHTHPYLHNGGILPWLSPSFPKLRFCQHGTYRPSQVFTHLPPNALIDGCSVLQHVGASPQFSVLYQRPDSSVTLSTSLARDFQQGSIVLVCALAARLLLRLLPTQLQYPVGFGHFGKRAAVKGAMRPNPTCRRMTAANSRPIVV